ncbi:uncharacterized protein Z518_02268 [Rhinocladiella mackenziei CBS 650.93]|uniref:Rhodopsin domain-containing protein n=1 Tax=Rhinocladiella mackenziei CBS 650.93 TaxID=1442369 RepID=A0A0D2JEK7_9EURO|nr:uncharacterized protein Z518_02268 [Rhinocladiella mackenziei CBS 650.93]KIX07615.1 hypothetical protein Z518_02268 [Rhinocladiella mackenziei CBS 650.93]
MTSEVLVNGGGGRMSDYNGATLEILTVVLAIVSFLVVLARGIARHRISRAIESTDMLLPLALVIAIAQSACVRFLLSNGLLGRHVSSLGAAEVSQYQKLTYISNLLFQSVLSLTQIIVVLLIKNVEPQLPVRIGCNFLLGLITVYSTLALSVLAFQCSLPTPWLASPGKCVDRQTFLIILITISLVIDVVTLILPVIMMCKLKTSLDKKIFVCILFGTRIALPLVTIPQVSHLRSVLVSHDPTWDSVSLQICIQVIMNIGIITACLPSLGRMMWETWSGRKSTWPSRDSSRSRDFGHELGLDNTQTCVQEKPHIPERNYALYTSRKDNLKNEVLVGVSQVGILDSTCPNQTLQKDPATPQCTVSRPDPVRMQKHPYRRPVSNRLSPVLEQPTSPQHPIIREATPIPAFGQHGTETERIPPSRSLSNRTQILSYVTETEGSFNDEDHSELDIDSYYLRNTQMVRSYIPSRTELVLQSMIEDLQKENSAVHPSQRWEYGWI